MACRTPGQALLWFALAVPIFLSVAGLAIDGGMLLTSRRQLQSVADGAARAGATRLDLARLRDSGGTDVQLDPALSVAAANAYLDERLNTEATWQVSPRVRVETTARRVHVIVSAEARTAFMRIVHIDTVPVEAAAFADVQYGIRGGTGT